MANIQWLHTVLLMQVVASDDDDDDATDKFTPTKHLTPPPHNSIRPAAAHTDMETPRWADDDLRNTVRGPSRLAKICVGCDVVVSHAAAHAGRAAAQGAADEHWPAVPDTRAAGQAAGAQKPAQGRAPRSRAGWWRAAGEHGLCARLRPPGAHIARVRHGDRVAAAVRTQPLAPPRRSRPHQARGPAAVLLVQSARRLQPARLDPPGGLERCGHLLRRRAGLLARRRGGRARHEGDGGASGADAAPTALADRARGWEACAPAQSLALLLAVCRDVGWLLAG